MIKKFCILVAIAAVSFVSSTERSNVSFNTTTTTGSNDTNTVPFVLNETMPTTSTTTTVSIDFSFDIHPDAMDLIQNVSSNFHQVYEHYLVSFSMDILKAGSTKVQELYEMYQPAMKDHFNTIWADLYKKIASFVKENSVPYALFEYGRVDMVAVPFESFHNHSVSSTHVTAAPLVVTNVSGIGNVGEMMIEMDSTMPLPLQVL